VTVAPTGDRRRARPLREQLRIALPLVPVWLVGVGIMSVVALGDDRLVDRLLGDANHVAGIEWYVGAGTHLVVLAWAVAAVSAAWGAWVARRVGRASACRFLRAGALITLYVLADDLLQIHSVVLPALTGMAKPTAQLLIVIVVAGWLLQYRADLARTRWAVLVGAGIALASSVGIDVFAGWGSPRLQLVAEDGAKLLGALGWATYFVVTTADIVASIISSRSAQDAEALSPSPRSGSRLGPG
jgi:hypothetical protein